MLTFIIPTFAALVASMMSFVAASCKILSPSGRVATAAVSIVATVAMGFMAHYSTSLEVTGIHSQASFLFATCTLMTVLTIALLVTDHRKLKRLAAQKAASTKESDA